LPYSRGMRACLLGCLAVVACSKSAPNQQTGGAGAPSAPELTASDVTIIWPLPKNAAERDTMIAATSVGTHGELLPAGAYKVPVLDERDSTVKDPAAERERLRVVSARFEPCRGSFGPPADSTCVNQLRLGFQVLRPGGGGAPRTKTGANDGAVLAFYKLSRAELLALARDLISLRDSHGGDTKSDKLGVHPLLARHGLGSDYANALQAKLLEYAGVKRLTRITFFTRTLAREPEWIFGALDVADGGSTIRQLATLDHDHQSLEGGGPRLVIKPTTSSPDRLDALLAVSGTRKATEREVAAYGAVLRIENPAIHNADTTGCAECHVTERVRRTAERQLGLRATAFGADLYEVSFSSTTQGKIDGENFHAASYLGANLAVITRTVNETSAVVTAMNALLAR
jgi:hypothetical protein